MAWLCLCTSFLKFIVNFSAKINKETCFFEPMNVVKTLIQVVVLVFAVFRCSEIF